MPFGSSTLARAVVEIGGNDSDLQNTLARASRSMERTGRKMQHIGRNMTATITAPFVAAGAAAVKFAADAEETRNLFNVAMGDMADEARKFAEARADALSLDPVSFQKTMAVFQQMFSSMGIAEDQALDMSQALSQLQVDMSSFFNLPMEEALQKLQSGIAGEIEPLRRLGVNVSQTKIEMVALREGMIEAGEEMTQQQKIQARFITIMEQLENAHGDFERTQGSLTNTMRQLKEQSRVVAREFGEILIPVAKDLADIAKGLVGFFKDMPDPMQATVVKVAALTAAIGPLVFVAGQLTTQMQALAGAFVTLRGAQIGSAVAGWASAFASLAVQVRSLSGALALLQAAMGPAGWIALGATAIVGIGVAAAFKRWGDEAERMAERLGEAREQLGGLAEDAKSLGRLQRAKLLSSLALQAKTIEEQIAATRRRLQTVGSGMSVGARSRLADEVEFLQQKLERVRDTMRQVREQAQRTFNFDQFRGSAAPDTGGGGGGGGTTATGGFSPIGFGRSLEQILRPKFVDLGIVTAEAFGRHIMRETRDALRQASEQARRLGLGPSRMRELVSPLGGMGFIEDAEKVLERQKNQLRKNVNLARAFKRALGTELSNALTDLLTNLESIGDVLRNLFRDILATVQRIVVRTAVEGLLSKAGLSFAGGFAHGGTIPAGSFGVVGEAGPELVSGPARVTPMGKGGGTTNVHQKIIFKVAAMDARSVRQALKEQKGTIAQIVGEAARESTSFRKQVVTGR